MRCICVLIVYIESAKNLTGKYRSIYQAAMDFSSDDWNQSGHFMKLSHYFVLTTILITIKTNSNSVTK